MIELITKQDWIKSEALRKEIFSFRFATFIDRLGWDVPNHDFLEFDEFDALLPVYMVSRDSLGRVNGVLRLLPTVSPYMLKNVFPQFLGDRSPPEEESVWELSRFAFKSYKKGSSGKDEIKQVFGGMFSSICEFSQEFGVEEILALFDCRISPILRLLKCRPVWEGPVLEIGGIKARAASFRVDEAFSNDLREANFAPERNLQHPPQLRKAA